MIISSKTKGIHPLNLVFISIYIFISMFLLSLASDFLNKVKIEESHKNQVNIVNAYEILPEYSIFNKTEIFDEYNKIKPSFIELIKRIKYQNSQENKLIKYNFEICNQESRERSDYWNIIKIFKFVRKTGLDFEILINSSSNCEYLTIKYSDILRKN